MQVYELHDQVEMQGEITYCIFNGSEQIDLTYEQAKYREIRYMWAESDMLYIEVEED